MSSNLCTSSAYAQPTDERFVTDDVAEAIGVGGRAPEGEDVSGGRDVDGREGEGARISRKSASIATSSMSGEDGAE
jgi:hypothetical protein